jgi:uncharacterized protein (TIGR02145 family)
MNKLFLFFALLFFACANVPAQVTIGSLEKPTKGTLLDLNSTNKGGLRLSNVTISDLEKIPFGNNVFLGITEATADVNMELRGVMVYNDGMGTTVPAGIYIWSGWKWTKDGRLDPASLPHGSGALTGKTRFDLALGNNGVNSCIPVSERKNQKTNFADRTQQDGATAPYSGVQVYTFTPKAGETVSHVRFDYVETSGVSIDSIVPELTTYATADNINAACKVIVYYRTTLNTELQGTTRNTGHKLKLYAIYNSDASYSTPANDQVLELSISLADCNFCGAYVSKNPDVWLDFMCHNLGADENADPFTPAAAIHGARYKWGLKDPAATQLEDQDPAYNNGFADWDSRGGTPPTSEDDWNMTTANPCPQGWRVPTIAEWSAVTNTSNNALARQGTWSTTPTDYTNFSVGLKIGDALFLPAAGNHFTFLLGRGNGGCYWSSNARGDMCCNGLEFKNDYVDTNANRCYYRINGFNVRCVAD